MNDKLSVGASLLERGMHNRGLLDSNIKVGIEVPQQVMGSLFIQVDDRWAVLASVGWQQWSKFGQVELGINTGTIFVAACYNWTF